MPDFSPENSLTESELPIRSRWKAAGKFFRDGDTGETVFVKAVTWGPFPPDQQPDLDAELHRVRHQLGANALRVYEVPDRDFLDRCAALGLRVFVGFPWSHHVDFIYDHRLYWDEKERFRRAVAEFRDHPAIAGWFVANEIPATLVRWMDPKKVNRALEGFLEAGREADPEALFSYANYPSTEYLCPRGQDFVSFNIYLENRDNYARYLRRIQHLAGDLPLLIAEFGLDSKAHGDEAQAETMAWHLEETARAGAAGTTLFAWSDRWFRGGETIDGWDFGLTRRDGSAKPALTRVAETWRDWHSPADALKSLDFPRPKMSIVVCSYKGARLLEPCLASFQKLDYPDFEVVVVNDGGDAEVAAVAEKFTAVRLINQEPHAGLSAARNRGARESTGEVIVYTDDDCEADPDWLTWLAYAFSKDDLAAAGGPNIPPPPDTRVKAMVAAAPGGPAHVLLNDVEAEHLPGCNLAVRRDAFDAIGGFDEQFWTAGDDVDFCWRLIEAGHRIGFHPAAMVWHHRRFTIKAYLKQQLGYGRAEAMLMPLYPERFGLRGGARWKGRVYLESPAARLATSGSRIYHGPRGYAPFQALYGDGSSHSPWNLLLDWTWVAVAVALFLINCFSGLAIPGMVGLGMLMATAYRALTLANRASIQPTKFEGKSTRIVIAFLALLQGPLRSWKRFHGVFHRPTKQDAERSGIAEKTETDLCRDDRKVLKPPFQLRSWTDRFWSTGDTDHHALLDQLRAMAAEDGIALSPSCQWGESDLELKTRFGWIVSLSSITEYHSKDYWLTRIRIRYFPTKKAAIFAMADLLLTAFFLLLFLILDNYLLLIPAVLAAVALLFVDPRRFGIALEKTIGESADSIGLNKVTQD